MSGRGVSLIGIGWLASCFSLPNLPAQPANDNLAGRQRITGLSGSATGNNAAATRENGEPDHAGSPASNSVWFAWRAPESGTVTFDTAGSSFDTVLAIYTGSSLAGLQEVESDDDSSPNYTSNVYFDATAGREYVMAVDRGGTE